MLRVLRHHHNVKTMQHSKSFMDRHRSELHSSNWRMGEVIRKAGVKIFQIETTLNNDTFPKPFDFLQKREWDWTVKDRASFVAVSKSLQRTPDRKHLLVACSDGIETRWMPELLVPVLGRDPALAAALLARDHCRGRDDATVAVLRRKD